MGLSADGREQFRLDNHVVAGRSRKNDPLRVLIAGGGVAALEALIALRRLAEERVSIEFLAREPQFWYRPLAVAEPFGIGHLHGLDLSAIADEFGAAVTLGALESVDAQRHIARTSAGAEFSYDVLLIAVGARPVEAVPGAFTFRGPADAEGFGRLLAEAENGRVRRLAFAVPGAVAWPLPLYELALQAGARLGRRRGATELTLVTHEERPLQLFGPGASEAMATLLAERGVQVRLRSYPVAFSEGSLSLAPNGSVAADRVVALPRLSGPALEGVPHAAGFIPTDRSGRVRGLADVFAAGDATAFPVKQGGLAAQQADAAAEAIASLAGAELTPQPFRPVLRGLILTGGAPLFARAELTATGDQFGAGTEALWWPPGKIVGRYLGAFLAERSGLILTPPSEREALQVEVDLSPLTNSLPPVG